MMTSDDTSPVTLDARVAFALRRELLRLATLEDDLAACEAAQLPYWSPFPASVAGHRAAARALREDADRFLPPAA